MGFEGKWVFDEKEDKFEFIRYCKLERDSDSVEPVSPWEREFNAKVDNVPITIYDIKNQVFTHSKPEFKRLFRQLKENDKIDVFLKYLTIYFDQFLKVSLEVFLSRIQNTFHDNVELRRVLIRFNQEFFKRSCGSSSGSRWLNRSFPYGFLKGS